MMKNSLTAKAKSIITSFIYDYIYIPVYFEIVYFRDLKKIKKAYGKFEKLSRSDRKKYTLFFKSDARNICGQFVPEIVKMVMDLRLNPERVLLDGDSRAIINQVEERFNFQKARMITAGIDGDYDYIWNFEEDCPADMPGDYDLIISQAMFEHLIDPFKHLEDLSKLLKRGGYLIIHTHLPGYTYHRFPIDAIRFFPDWFESSAKKLGLKVKRKFLRDFNAIHLLEK